MIKIKCADPSSEGLNTRASPQSVPVMPACIRRMLYSFRNQVVCIDSDAARSLNSSRAKPIFEPFLDALIARATRAGRLSFATDQSRGSFRRCRVRASPRHAIAA
jgi:hypothetical protein